jgi:hypothetical protein
MCVCVCACVCACVRACVRAWHVSMRIFNLCMISLRKIRLKAFVTDTNNQLAWKCIKRTCHTVFGLDVADRLVDNAFYINLTEDQVWISLKWIFMYFPWCFIPLPPLPKSSQKFTFDGQMVIFFYYRKHPNTSLHLFVIDFTILHRFRTFRNIVFENVIFSPFLEIWHF